MFANSNLILFAITSGDAALWIFNTNTLGIFSGTRVSLLLSILATTKQAIKGYDNLERAPSPVDGPLRLSVKHAIEHGGTMIFMDC